MNTLKLLPVILSCLLLGAHFYRGGLVMMTVLCAAIPLLMFRRSPWIPRLFQALLLLGAIEWLRTLYLFAAMRIAWGEPWYRLAVILGSVALFTGLSGLVFRTRSLRAYYRSADR